MDAVTNLKEKVQKFAQENCNVPEIQFILKEPDNVLVSEVAGCGVINYIIRVQSPDRQHSLILKYGEEHARHMPDYCLGLRRQVREYEALKLMDRILPGSVPKPYCHDTKHNIICMEDMGHMKVLGDELLKGEIDLEVATTIGQLLAQMHQATYKKNVAETEWQKIEEYFGGEDMVNNWDDLSIRMFQEEDPLVGVSEVVKPVFLKHSSEILTRGVGSKIKEMVSQQECFILKDNHWMSMFVENSRIVLFDFEFGFIGNPMDQLAWAANNYFMCMKKAIQNQPEKASDIRELSKKAFRNTVEAYFEVVDNGMTCYKPQQDMATLALCLGSEIFFFGAFAGSGQLITLTDDEKIDLIKLGSHLLTTSEQISSLQDIINILFPSEQ